MNWKSQTITLADLNLDMNEIYLNLGYGGNVPDIQILDMLEQMIDEITVFCQPSVGYCICEGSMPDNKHLIINNQQIKVGQVITGYFQNCTHFATFIVTAGIEFDAYYHQFKVDGDMFSEFLAYSVGTEIAEASVRFVSGKIALEAANLNMGCTHSYSPGYCSWNVREQESLFRILPEKPCGVELNESNLMYPEKSVSGIIGLGVNVTPAAHSCEICGMINCFKRKS
jgi:hypothetical protein